jgi:hypothetical protein
MLVPRVKILSLHLHGSSSVPYNAPSTHFHDPSPLFDRLPLAGMGTRTRGRQSRAGSMVERGVSAHTNQRRQSTKKNCRMALVSHALRKLTARGVFALCVRRGTASHLPTDRRGDRHAPHPQPCPPAPRGRIPEHIIRIKRCDGGLGFT